MEEFSWLPFTFEEKHPDQEIECCSFTGVSFKQDFGPWIKGQCVAWLSIDFAHGLAIEHNEAGENTAFTQFKIVSL